jgi:hypothetical protein
MFLQHQNIRRHLYDRFIVNRYFRKLFIADLKSGITEKFGISIRPQHFFKNYRILIWLIVKLMSANRLRAVFF